MSHQDPVVPAGHQGQSDATIGVVPGVVGTVVVFLVGALSVVESGRLDGHCFHSHPPAGLTPLGEGHTDASPTLFPIGHSCVWETAAGPTA